MSRKMLSALAVFSTLTAPSYADPAFGFGVTVTFGSGQMDTGIGVRVFSDSEKDKMAASLGLDYMMNSQSWRGALGAAYMMDNSYLELSGGYYFDSGSFDVGLGGGWVDTTAPAADGAGASGGGTTGGSGGTTTTGGGGGTSTGGGGGSTGGGGTDASL